MAAQELLLSEVTAEGPTPCCAMQSSTTNIFIFGFPQAPKTDLYVWYTLAATSCQMTKVKNLKTHDIITLPLQICLFRQQQLIRLTKFRGHL